MSVIPEVAELEEYDEDYFVNSNYFIEESAEDVWKHCVLPSIDSVIPIVARLIGLNFLFSCLLSTGLLSKTQSNLIAGCIGIYLISTLESGKLILFICFTFSYSLISLCYSTRSYLKVSIFLKIFLISLLVLCEYFLIEPRIWLQIRGIVMILFMKVISITDDMEKLNFMPSFFDYFGYSLCGANVMFGPWISFSDYSNLYKNPVKMRFLRFLTLIQVMLLSLFFLSISNCWANFMITQEANRWFVAYREALSFRTSHYFVSYLAEAGMISAGFSSSKKISNGNCRYVITEPLEIELPSSLSMVVRKWNQPMHEFLKKYVYRSWLRHGKFTAILGTFLMSSLLHGLEFKVSVVLVSIGVFSYLQVAPRDRMADIFDCCIRVRPCKDCKHKYNRSSIRVMLVLILYSLATMVHLAYLGILMDPSTDKVGIYEKWQNLYFVSHIVMFVNILIIS